MPSWASKPACSPLFFLTLLTTQHHTKLTFPQTVLFSLAASDEGSLSILNRV